MSQALEGIRVIDFTHDQAGPSCTQMLAWLGADVIKIERPPHGDRARRLWNADNPNLDSYFFLLLNSNKRSTVINLRTEEGKEIAIKLAALGELFDIEPEMAEPADFERPRQIDPADIVAPVDRRHDSLPSSARAGVGSRCVPG